MPTSTQIYPNVSVGGLSFTNINVGEVDVGNVDSFTSNSTLDLGSVTDGTYSGLEWASFSAGVYDPGSSESLTFNFTATATTPGQVIDSLTNTYVPDLVAGPGTHLTATETVYDTSGNVVASQTYTYGGTLPTLVTFTQGQQTVNVTVTYTESVDSTGIVGGSGVNTSDLQFAFGQASTSQLCSIGDIVFLDQNGTGLESGFDSGPGVQGVTVELLDSTGTNILATTTTDANGIYSFNNLQAATYEVKFVAPTGFTFSPEGVGGNPAVNSSASQTTGVTSPITLTAGEQDHNVEAGLVPAPAHTGGTAALGDYVWLDANGNGLQDSNESGVAGVKVELLNGTGTSVLATTTTDNTGHYAFTNLNAGSYEVEFFTPTGDAFTTQTAGSNRAIDSNPNVSTGITAPVTLTAGQIDSTIDAGLISTSGISILKTPCSVVVNSCGQISYTFSVTNTGSTPLTNISLRDNIGSASHPQYVTPTAVTSHGYNVGDANHNGVLDKGESWQYALTVSAPIVTSNGDCYSSAGSSYCGSGGDTNYCGSGGGYSYNNGCGGYSYSNDCSQGGSYGYSGSYDCGYGGGSYGGSNDCGSGGGYSYSNGCGSYSSNYDCGYSGSSYGGGGNDCGSGGGYSYSNGCGGYSSNYDCGYGGSGYGGSNDCGYGGGYGSGSNCGSGGYGGSYDCGSYNYNCGSGGGYSGGSNCGSGGGQTQTGVAGIADTVTVTATTANCQTVTASDTKEVQILSNSSNVSVDGSTPTGSLSSLYGTAKTLEFTYSPGNTVSTKTISGSLASVTGSNSSGMAFMEISNNSNPFASGAKIYFEGEVTTGEKIFADATTNVLTNTPVAAPNNHFDTTAGTDIFAYVFASQQAFAAGAAPIQAMAYNASGSQAMHFGDVIGSLKVVGYVGSNGGHLAS